MNLDGPMLPPNPGVDLAHQLDVMVASGVESLRIVVDWATIQPYRRWADVPLAQQSQFINADGMPLRLAPVDEIVKLASVRHLTILPVVVDAPSWDAMPATGFEAIATPEAVEPYAAFMKALVDRYGPNGKFWQDHSPRVAIRAWQVWNEPNISGFWAVQPNFEPSYVKLLRAAHTAIKRADPDARIVLAGMVNTSWLFISRIYRIRGARDLFDVAAVHPYTRYPAGVLTILGKVRRVMDAAGDSTKPIVADEVGWNSSVGKSPNHFGVETTEAGQAHNLAELLPRLGKQRARLRLIGFSYYDWAGVEDRGGYEFDFAGLFRFTNRLFTAKPAYSIFRRAALALEDCKTKAALATRCRTA
jgi:hypothetical protein